MAHDITKDVIGCKEFEVQKINSSGEPAEFLGSISLDNHIVNKGHVDAAIGSDHPHQNVKTTASPNFAGLTINNGFILGLLQDARVLSDTDTLTLTGGSLQKSITVNNDGITLNGDLTTPDDITCDELTLTIGANPAGLIIKQGLQHTSEVEFLNTSNVVGRFGFRTLTDDGTDNNFIRIYRDGANALLIGYVTTGFYEIIALGLSLHLGTIGNTNQIILETNGDTTIGDGNLVVNNNIKFGGEMHNVSDGDLVLDLLNDGNFIIQNGNLQVEDIKFGTTGKGLTYGTISVVSNATETTINTQNVYVQVTGFNINGVSNSTTPNHTNDHITITEEGDYKIECCITANSIAGAGATFEFEVKKNNGNVRVGAAHGDKTLAGGGSEAGSITICTIATLAVNDTIELWTKNESNTQNIIIEDASLSVLRVGG